MDIETRPPGEMLAQIINGFLLLIADVNDLGVIPVYYNVRSMPGILRFLGEHVNPKYVLPMAELYAYSRQLYFGDAERILHYLQV